MKKVSIGTILSIFLFLFLLPSCNLELLKNGQSVNDFIYPYLEFKSNGAGGGVLRNRS